MSSVQPRLSLALHGAFRLSLSNQIAFTLGFGKSGAATGLRRYFSRKTNVYCFERCSEEVQNVGGSQAASKGAFPVILHADDDPILGCGFAALQRSALLV